ncbi:DUF4250 domain-containing protein [Photobacterium aphoticum]|uniref:DUF4250 domain-containing protein n=1 Tax=Photobacterium aphoticum TaxID=754436 RepID=A0A090R0I7_9GAMM|nr:DUF4250 domain-containing protein [Photobacterium aphoticum]KLU99323.1 hypothetical protein ABT58_18000 [Photobacterium aphoticum]PSU55771.1 DUF4250 domain-containing protein [Photobacterium aphoticum]GAL07619.1 hypothetical protein JCM19237_857 [Photobacterium aphoticum]GHA59860.1 hypothetical protein GCM10007086_37130 [Photobacterium aphoticum]
MNLSNFEKMDPVMLMSIVNMKIRDEFGDLDALVKYYDIDKDTLVAKLAAAGFDYLPDAKQFR